ncbi:acyl-CoA reductase [Muricauda sp. CAU 1633]|uniref:acyl-CoA reductase n=1 Tax=Allomuricauda sp. CAU 1633 TaxID=2816036 RepID=UPI001A8EB43C|nr:acyl-CoA reductase [Muricauda sp. CAU 1633]MBO0323313.1 acyl-CoA reductase [Muricauda sp. CAU 1633]
MTAHLPILEAFVKLGNYLTDFCEYSYENPSEKHANFEMVITQAQQQNGWFTRENILFALKQWSALLTDGNLKQWLSNYNLNDGQTPKTIGIVMAGNIPMVGFHDFLSVLCSGNKVLAKLSSNDKALLPYITQYLIEQEPLLAERIEFTEGKLEDFDAVIATGSNNTSRYFEYYFGKKPNIIRKNRNSVAVLTGNETQKELKALGEDIFRYYGLGCRNVSKIYVPRTYDFDLFFKAIFEHGAIIHQHKYANNYDYNKAVYLMSNFKIRDNGFLIVKEDESFASPIATLFYSYYESEDELRNHLKDNETQIQCVVSSRKGLGDVPFGETQMPKLHEYADGVDTMEFLLQL